MISLFQEDGMHLPVLL